MNAVIQRVNAAKVKINGRVVGEIDKGLLILLGIEEGDDTQEGEFLSRKISNLRIFEDKEKKMNLSLLDVFGGALVIPNFTLQADAKKGNRPSYTKAANPEIAENLYKYFIGKLKEIGINKVEEGIFGANMQVSLTNDGPVTIILDTNVLMPKKDGGR